MEQLFHGSFSEGSDDKNTGVAIWRYKYEKRIEDPSPFLFFRSSIVEGLATKSPLEGSSIYSDRKQEGLGNEENEAGDLEQRPAQE